jgi:predicted RNA-binding protein YlqC (UPF0109 family)
MTNSGSNPFAEPDFSALRSSAADESEEDYGEEDVELEDDELDVSDDGENLYDEDETAEPDAADETNEVRGPPQAPGGVDIAAAVEEDAGNRVAGGTARAVLEHVARSIVDDPEGVTIEVTESRGGIRLSLHVAQGDMGRIIGRRGRTAQALRTLVRAAAARDGQEASVDIVD